MSNFAGVTFSQQKVTPSDDAVFRQAVTPDGILTGCAMTYSGSTLTLAAGYLLVAGRVIHHTAATNWTVADATSGYARVVLTIDLTLAASKDSFEQVTTAVQYASSVNGFSSLTQNDINGSGTKYQVVLCVVSLSTGGISGFSSKLASCASNPSKLPVVPISKGGTGATTVAGILAALGLANPCYASAYGSSSSLTLPTGEITQLTLDTWKHTTGEFSFSGGGIVMPKAGTVLICAAVYFDSTKASNPGRVGPYVKQNGVEISGVIYYSEDNSAQGLSPFLVSVAAGDVLTLCARSVGQAGSCMPNGGATGLTVIYM